MTAETRPWDLHAQPAVIDRRYNLQSPATIETEAMQGQTERTIASGDTSALLGRKRIADVSAGPSAPVRQGTIRTLYSRSQA
jgi:hypothetical protein